MKSVFSQFSFVNVQRFQHFFSLDALSVLWEKCEDFFDVLFSNIFFNLLSFFLFPRAILLRQVLDINLFVSELSYFMKEEKVNFLIVLI